MTKSPERWDQIEAIYHAALDRPEAGRAAFLREACHEDPELLAEVASLLGFASKGEKLLESPAAVIAGARPALSPGARLGVFEIVEPLGAGGMGEVYRARDTRLGRIVALKVLPLDPLRSPERRARFEREARAVSRLSHPNICRLYDVGREGDVDFLVMECLEGEPLAERLARSPLPLQEALTYAVQVAEALEVAHSEGVVHRDLKPANVVLTRSGAMLLDFGLAKLIPLPGGADVGPTDGGDEIGPIAPTTRSGLLLGTPQYMSPEQLEGRPVDARADVFAFGCLLFEMVAGERTFRGESQASLVAAILRDDPPRLDALRPEVPRDVADVVARCLARDRELRYRSGGELLAALRTCRDRPAASAGGPGESRGSDGSAPGRRRRLGIAVAAVAAVVVVASVARWAVKPGAEGRDGEGASAVAAVLPEATTGAPVQSIAVLPFADMSETGDQKYFADGLAEELMGMLARVPGLKVPGRTSSFSFEGTPTTIADIGRALGVAHVLEGSVRKSGDRLRVSAQLIRADDGFQLWSETYDRQLDDVFRVQDEISGAVVRALELRLLEADMPRAVPTHSQEAYALYLQARALHSRSTHADNLTGISYLERALELDPGFAPAWFGLGDALVYDFFEFGGNHAEVRRRAGEAAETALRLDPELADAHLLMGRVLGELDWNWPAAEVELRRALELDPNNWLALWVMSNYVLLGDRYDESLRLAERMLGVDPANFGAHWAVGDAFLWMGRLADAEASYRKMTELSPTSAGVHTWLGIALILQGRNTEALAAMERETDEGWRLYGTALALESLGRRDEAERRLAALTRDFADRRAWSIGSLHACRGEIDEAFSWLERAYRQREGRLPFLEGDPCASRLEHDPRYSELLRRMNV